jgi:hypothetical protein
MARIIIVMVLVLAALGFYLGWFHIGSDRTDAKSSITVTVDKDKMKEDERKAKEKAQDVGHGLKDSSVKSTP